MRLEGKSALITGAGSGLGRETALLFASEGARVVVTDLLADRADAVASEIKEQGGEALAVRADVRTESEVAAAVDAGVATFGAIDIMFANAGINVPGRGVTPFEELSAEHWQEVQSTNLTGVFYACKHAVRVMKPRRRGAIVATSSAASLTGYPGMAAYSASKGGINGLVKSLSFEVGEFGIRVNAVCPTHGMSPNFMLAGDAPVVGASYEELMGPWDPAVAPMPLKLDRPPGLRDNANAVLFLASDESAYISGVCLPTTDGGTLSRVAMFFPDNFLADFSAALEARADERSE
jgi:NAD(P)-dependent dehydrogenase (short-subunit alcohol dehydrogenase family)